eukprot:3431292-Amphidinium_carterae.1
MVGSVHSLRFGVQLLPMDRGGYNISVHAAAAAGTDPQTLTSQRSLKNVWGPVPAAGVCAIKELNLVYA